MNCRGSTTFFSLVHYIQLSPAFVCCRHRMRRDRRGSGPGREEERDEARQMPNDTARCGAPHDMRYEITVAPDHLKADLFDRETAEETREFLDAVSAEARKHERLQVLISVHSSKAIFKVEQYGILDYFKELGGLPKKYRVALTGDSEVIRISQQYIESLARQHSLNVRSFQSEQAALNWLRDRRWLPDRRERHERFEGQERRQHQRRPKSGAAGIL